MSGRRGYGPPLVRVGGTGPCPEAAVVLRGEESEEVIEFAGRTLSTQTVRAATEE
ncbi:hypothetical protein [Streptomyces sp. NPDC059378]|uniref:hypothetical protein n=1 Tax=Streptomyces sp. NPDC059378 TaxID=3346815 RepID=UPI0036B5D619